VNALITGGSRGIGAATARLLASKGIAVAVNGRDEAAIARVVGEIRSAGGRAIAAPADCTDAAALERMRARVAAEIGAPQIRMAFAGGGGSVEMSEAEWRTALDANLTSAFLTVRTFLPAMLEGVPGSIVLMSSTAGRAPGQASVAYAAAKAGLVMLAKHLAVELAPRGIRVNCLAPSAVRNERMERAMSKEQLARLGASFPLGRIGEPDDIARAAVFLASEESSWITGATLDITGGRVIV
jgi:3-oxoacyl-[acyl-carrier protein] reductase